MSDRKSLITALWLTSSLALLASFVVAPVRISGFDSDTISSKPDCLRRNFALTEGRPKSHFSATMATDAVLQVNALPSENKEQDQADPLDESRVSFLIPRSFPKNPDRQLIAPCSILSLYPLRC